MLHELIERNMSRTKTVKNRRAEHKPFLKLVQLN
jgi:hypothetical protein